MGKLFELKSNVTSEGLFSYGKPKDYKNLGENEASLFLLEMGRSNAEFLRIPLECLIIWYNRYKFMERGTVHARAPHRCIELFFILLGKIGHHQRPFRDSKLETHSIGLVHSLAMDSVTSFEKDQFIRTVDFHYDPKELEKYLNRAPRQLDKILNEYEAGRQYDFLHHSFRPTGEIISMAKKIENYLLDPNMDPHILNNLAISFLLKVLDLHEEHFGVKNLDVKLQERIRWIEKISNRLLQTVAKERITTDQLAKYCRTNKKYAEEDFKRVNHMGLIEYMNRLQLDFVLQLLLTTDMPIIQIAAEAGFGNPNHLYPRFKAVYGETPKTYRGNMQAASSSLILPDYYTKD